jgi:pyruvate/2-oxoglutarate dehydrogenase complex dihydrolipoamide dehydrogenase (E3) component
VAVPDHRDGTDPAWGATRGFIKLVVDASDNRIFGCHIVGYDAANLIHEAVAAMVAGMARTALGRMVHIHPTLAEGLRAAAGGVHH